MKDDKGKIGSSFDNYLKHEGIEHETNSAAIKRLENINQL